jgi:hypothetical protein
VCNFARSNTFNDIKLNFMKEKLIYWLRYVAVLPGALLASILSTFVLHLSLYYSLREIIAPYPETPERVLTPLVMATVFIWTGSQIAPKYKNTTTIILFGLWLFILGGVVFLTMTNSTWLDQKLSFQVGGLPTIMSVVGALFGLFKARQENKDTDIGILNI